MDRVLDAFAIDSLWEAIKKKMEKWTVGAAGKKKTGRGKRDILHSKVASTSRLACGS